MIGIPWEGLNELAHGWLRYIATSLVDATVGFILVMSIWLVVRNRVPARWSYLLFLLVPLKLIIPFHMPILPTMTFARGVEEASRSETVTPTSPSVAADTDLWTSPNNGEPVLATQPSTTASRPTTTGEIGRAGPTWSTFLMLVWAGVLALLCGRLGCNHVRLSRLLRDSRPLDLDRYDVDYRGLCRRLNLRGGIPVMLSRHVDVPAVVGLRRPRILLPEGLLESLKPQQLACIVAHELAHLKWHDLWVSCAERFICLVHFANPALWIATHYAHREREMACDDAALAATGIDRRTCGATLLSVLQFAQQRQHAVASAIALFEKAGLHRRRLEHIMVRQVTYRRVGPVAATCLLLASGMMVLPNLRLAQATMDTQTSGATEQKPAPQPVESPALKAFALLPPLQATAEGPLVHVSYDIAKLSEESGTADSLIEVITHSVLAREWQHVGGQADIAFDPATRQLQVWQYVSAQQAIGRILSLWEAILDQEDVRTAHPTQTDPAPQAYPLVQDGQLVTTAYTIPSLLYANPTREGKGEADYDSVIRLVTSSIAPDSWDAVGGPGSLSVWPPGEVLIIAQPPDIQRQIAKLFTMLHTIPAVNSQEMPPSWDPLTLSTRTFNMALTPGEPRQQIELETRLFPVHDLLPAATPGAFPLSPRAVGTEQLGAWLALQTLPEQLPEPVGVTVFPTKGVVILDARRAGHERAVKALTDLRDRLRRASAAQQTDICREIFPPAFARPPVGGLFAIVDSREAIPDRVYLYGACGADEQLKRLGPLADFVRFTLIDSDVTDRGLEEIARIGGTVQLTIWSDHITDAGVAGLSPLQVVGTLSIRGSQITDQVVTTIMRWPTVQQIDLSHTALSDAGLEKLMQAAETMQRYFGVDVRQTKVTPATVTRLRKEHPRCRIEF